MDPSAAQAAALRSHCGAQRFAFNRALVKVKANLAQRAAERSYGVAEEQLTPAVSWSAYRLRKQWNAAKHDVAPWWAENSKEPYSSGLANVAMALSKARIARLHTQVANARADGLHQLSTRLCREFDTVVIENLNVSGMLKNRRLTRHVAGVGMGELRRQLAYKSRWSGRHLVVANRWYPSSKTCSDCGAVKAKLPLSERIYACDECGYRADRDLNAACNLAALARGTTDSSQASPPSCGVTKNEPAGNPGKTSHAGDGYRHGKTTPTGVANAAP